MASKHFSFVLILVLASKVDSASLLERSYEYFLSLGKSFAPTFLDILDCWAGDNPWNCAKEKATKLLDSFEDEVNKQRRMWQEAADAEIQSSGRSLEDMPSKLGKEVEQGLFSLADVVQHGVARALSRKHHEDSGGIDTITISTGGGQKKKTKKKKQKPAKIQLVHPVVMMKEQERGFGKVQTWVIGDEKFQNSAWAKNLENQSLEIKTPGDNVVAKSSSVDTPVENVVAKNSFVDLTNDVSVAPGVRKGRGILSDLWDMGQKGIDELAAHAVKSENAENGIDFKTSSEEQRGKKKKKKAILKLLILGAVLKAKIATLLQILSFKLQVKFFIIALIGLGINLARFWLDLKKAHQHQPQKVIYYEHAQHQHHYDHEEEPGWGPWSRSMDPPEEVIEPDSDIDFPNSPYRAQIDRNSQIHSRPTLIRV